MNDRSGPSASDSSSSDYHARELAIALSEGHEGHILPKFKATPRSILDIGGGSGQTVSAIPEWERACVLDIDLQALQRGTKSDPKISFLCGSGEALPFAHATFDAVVCRVSLPYMHIPTALREISRVLTENGEIWFTLHGWPSIGRRLKKAARRIDLKDLLFIGYVLLNSAALHIMGRQFRLGKHCESIQFRRSIERELTSAGFSQISFEYGHFFVAHACKRSAPRV
jgi:ubiquinone/menaquinone biosynthesis C-methylase UbiE